MKKNYIVTGGAGFIGANFIHQLLESEPEANILNIDALTYAGNLSSLEKISNSPNYRFSQTNICDAKGIHALFTEFQPDYILHFAAESHVDRSIDGPDDFIETNINGTYTLLKQAKALWESYSGDKKNNFRFLHVSTDEVYGTLGKEGLFTEETPYAPNSPYSASKAASDHLVRAWHHTYGFPCITTNCSNNYGSYQFPEKLIPVIIFNAIEGKQLPIYGKGENIRDWLFVKDHCKAILTALHKGNLGETYNVGGFNEKTNIEVVNTICEILDKMHPKESGSYKDQITFVKDRPGHDMRYAIDATKINKELGWSPEETFESGIQKTVEWYLANKGWVENIFSGGYRLERIGLKK